MADQKAPEHVVVVGAGMVGLATAWFLQAEGVRVTVVDRDGVAAGSSWGNAGWLAPALTLPLPDPAILGMGVKATLDPVVAGLRAVHHQPAAAEVPRLVRPALHAGEVARGDGGVHRGQPPSPRRVRRPRRRRCRGADPRGRPVPRGLPVRGRPRSTGGGVRARRRGRRPHRVRAGRRRHPADARAGAVRGRHPRRAAARSALHQPRSLRPRPRRRGARAWWRGARCGRRRGGGAGSRPGGGPSGRRRPDRRRRRRHRLGHLARPARPAARREHDRAGRPRLQLLRADRHASRPTRCTSRRSASPARRSTDRTASAASASPG